MVALKVVLPHCNSDQDFLEMMRDEARITSALRHPNIARTFEWGEVGSQHYLAMEYVDGVDLRTILSHCRQRSDHPPVEHILRIAIDACLGLYAAHVALDSSGRPLCVVHRDVSPSNVLVSFLGDVKVCDFGIAKANFSRSRTRAGVVKGKVRYMSPEQTLGKRLDARSDVFAMGVVVYESLTLGAAFAGTSEREMMERIRSADLPPPSTIGPGIPVEVDRVLLRALAKRPEARYQTARALADSLQEVLDDRWPTFERGHLAAFVQGLFADRMERSRNTLSEYEAGERVGRGAATELAAPVPDEGPHSPGGLGDRVRSLFRGRTDEAGASKGPDTGVAVAPTEPGGQVDVMQTDEQPVSSWGFDSTSKESATEDLAEADVSQDDPTDVVAAPAPPEGA